MIADPLLPGVRYRFGITIGGFPFGKYWTLGGFTDDLAKSGWTDIVARDRLPSDPDPIGSFSWKSLVEATRTGPVESGDSVLSNVDLYWSMATVSPGIATAAAAAAKAACESIGGVWDPATGQCKAAGVVTPPVPMPLPLPLQPQPQYQMQTSTSAPTSTTTWLVIGTVAVLGLWFATRRKS